MISFHIVLVSCIYGSVFEIGIGTLSYWELIRFCFPSATEDEGTDIGRREAGGRITAVEFEVPERIEGCVVLVFVHDFVAVGLG